MKHAIFRKQVMKKVGGINGEGSELKPVADKLINRLILFINTYRPYPLTDRRSVNIYFK